MKKYLTTLWVGDTRNLEELKKKLQERNSQCKGSYVTIKITPTTEEGEQKDCINIFSDGVCFITCDNYEIDGGESDDFWFDYFRFYFDGITLSISTLGKKIKRPKVDRNFNMNFPVLIDE
jgi:hypothetical protein